MGLVYTNFLFFACTFVNLPESVKNFHGQLASVLYHLSNNCFVTPKVPPFVISNTTLLSTVIRTTFSSYFVY